ncbi:MAG TPA: hypothetical protein VN310_02220 [Candidatus Dormibacteraeota bacterium]|nr:hypothetical protein [Candidatus Dormibacteraeota bacterium]
MPITATNSVPIPANGPAGPVFDVDIASFTGQATFLDMLLKVKPMYIDQDFNRSFQVIDGATYIAALNADFDPSVVSKILGHFGGDQNKLQQAIDSIKGQTTTPGTVFDVIVKAASSADDASKAAELLAPTLSLAANMGTTIHFGSIIVKEVGYASPNAKLPAAVQPEMTGRGYASELPARKLLDASDDYYLSEIKQILGPGGTNLNSFFGAILDVLTQCGATNIGALSDPVRETVGDFLAVYFAETDRNAMSGLQQHSWQKDLLHATCLGGYVAGAGGDITRFWAMATSGSRSGIGETREARQQLSTQVCKAMAKINPAVCSALQGLIAGAGGASGGDLIQQLADYLNNPNSSATVLANADKISTAATAFMVAIHDNASLIVKSGVPSNITSAPAVRVA